MINYGAIPSKTDLRDYRVKAGVANVESFQLDNLPEVKNQQSVGSCVAHSMSSVLEWFNKKETDEYRKLSVGFIYGMQGVAFNCMSRGMVLRDACKIAQKYGDCLNDTISFNIEMPDCCNRLKENLNDEVYSEAAICRVESYARCYSADSVKHALMNYGPVMMSVKWHKKYKVDKNNVINFDTKSDHGYHAIMVYGFNEQGWLCQNSYGKLWGDAGRFVLPYSHGFTEAWSFVDAENSDIHKPARNSLLDVLYKFFNFIINLFKR